MRQQLDTRHLHLQPLDQSDIPRLTLLASDKRVSDTLLHVPFPFIEADARDMVGKAQQACAEGTAYHYGISKDGDLIGVASLIRTVGEPNSAYVVYWLGVPYWNQGYATEATRALLDLGFQALGLQLITAKHAPWNHASARVLQKVGMTYCGIKPKAVFKHGQWWDDPIWSISADAWKMQSAALNSS